MTHPKLDANTLAHAADWINDHIQQIDSASVPWLPPDRLVSREDVMAFSSHHPETPLPNALQQATTDMNHWREFLKAAAPEYRNDIQGKPQLFVSPTPHHAKPLPHAHTAQETSDKRAILAYSPWHANRSMEQYHAGLTPEVRDANGNLIPYDPMDQRVLDWDLKNFRQAGITTLAMDWSNNQPWPEGSPDVVAAQGNSIAQMEVATEKIAQFYAGEQAKGRPTPKLTIMIRTEGWSPEMQQQKADQVKGLIAKYPGVFETLKDTDGQVKPLLLKFVGDNGYAPWDDPSLNVVTMGGYPDFKGWENTAAWEQHNNNPLQVEGHTWVTLSAGNRGFTGWEDSRELHTRQGGAYMEQAAQNALKSNPDVLFIQSYYEGTQGEELDAERTNDIVPSVENGRKDWNTLTQTLDTFLKS